MRRSPLRPRSEKNAALRERRRAFVEEQFSRRSVCEALARALRWRIAGNAEHAAFIAGLSKGCTRVATEPHEPLTRARAPGPDTILDADNLVCCCHHCHRHIHAHPRVAEQLDLLRSGRGRA